MKHAGSLSTQFAWFKWHNLSRNFIHSFAFLFFSSPTFLPFLTSHIVFLTFRDPQWQSESHPRPLLQLISLQTATAAGSASKLPGQSPNHRPVPEHTSPPEPAEQRPGPAQPVYAWDSCPHSPESSSTGRDAVQVRLDIKNCGNWEIFWNVTMKLDGWIHLYSSLFRYFWFFFLQFWSIIFVISIFLFTLLVIYNCKPDLSVSVLFHISLFFSSRDVSQSKLLKFSLGQKKTSRSASSAVWFFSYSSLSFLQHTSSPPLSHSQK